MLDDYLFGSLENGCYLRVNDLSLNEKNTIIERVLPTRVDLEKSFEFRFAFFVSSKTRKTVQRHVRLERCSVDAERLPLSYAG